ncbi:MAG TPA: ABC transporter permease [Gemmatimonadaceae bacterium]|nr:ABC transporter permease [Gemmatimonadaceae bacterium]
MTGTGRLELSIAWRYLRSRRGSRLLSFISVIAVAGVVVGVSALIVIIGVMNGLQTDLREKILVGSPDVHVLTFGESLRVDDWRNTMAKVREVPGVVDVAPFVLSQGLATSGNGYHEAVSIRGIAPGDSGSAQVTSIRDHATYGDFTFRDGDGDGERRGAVLGHLLAQRLNAHMGSTLSIITAQGSSLSPLFGGLVPRFFDFEVTGIFETGMYEYDNSYVYMDLAAAQELAGLDTAVSGLEVRTTDRWIAPDVAAAIDTTLGFPYRTSDWQQQNSSLFRALKLEKLGMAVILTLIIIVAAFNIVSTLTMVVRDKTREIGILKAMGMRPEAIRRIFLLQGAFIGIVGTGLGLIIGVGVGLALERFKLIALDPSVYFIDHLPVQLQVGDVGLIVGLSIAVAIVATLHPASVAAKLYPIEAIRSE